MVCVMTKHHPYSGWKSISMEQLSHLKQTAYGTSFSNINSEELLHISNNAKIHQQFMQEEGTICIVPYQACLTQYEPKGFVAKQVTDLDTIKNYLIYNRDIHEKKEALFQAFMEIAESTASEM